MKIQVTFDSGQGPQTIELRNRQGWTLYHLAKAGWHGITTIERPALRLSAYVHRLRERGFAIETEMEAHGGSYKGLHARYRLLTDVSVQLQGDVEGQA
ncbi:helix-turn-helix domain-containing protein [Pseudohalocynthiibacter sp. F2068]|uniref:winged helix domain-containing protein n=1 Tax=Pseudohalocynthiibacter sp. F2068 TaxID=2926418 RepID=UPI001FF4D938|nr:helix-turn-helix domain-containing protein [Pseudohalocynthiibacter sp. F2068]MCK0102351.1 hypothetical protein [Pseudohalocynthiibacter sp. F2068]